MDRLWLIIFLLSLCIFAYFLIKKNKTRMKQIKQDELLKTKKYTFKEVQFEVNPSEIVKHMTRNVY